MARATKAETVFWIVLSFFAGAVIGALAYAFMMPPKTTVECKDNGRSTQVKDGVEYHTYIPALDNCK